MVAGTALESKGEPNMRGEDRKPGWEGQRGIKEISEIQRGTSLVVQCLRLHAPNAGVSGSIPGPGSKTPHAT